MPARIGDSCSRRFFLVECPERPSTTIWPVCAHRDLSNLWELRVLSGKEVHGMQDESVCPHCQNVHDNRMEEALCPLRPQQVPLMVEQFGELGSGDYRITDR